MTVETEAKPDEALKGDATQASSEAGADVAESSNAEAAKWRVRLREQEKRTQELAKELEAVRNAEQKRAAEELQKRGEFQKLYEEAAAKLASVEDAAKKWQALTQETLKSLEESVSAEVLAKIPAGLGDEARIDILRLLSEKKPAEKPKVPQGATPLPVPSDRVQGKKESVAQLRKEMQDIQVRDMPLADKLKELDKIQPRLAAAIANEK